MTLPGVTSPWLEEDEPRRPSLGEDASADVAVIGGGIAGVSSAYALARQGASVVVLEAQQLAAAASGRNAGFVLAGVAENFVAASERYGEPRARRVYEFTRRNRERLRALVARHGIDCEFAWNGSLQIAGDDAEWDEVRESARRLAARGVRVTIDQAQRAACYADDGELHPVRFVRGLARAAEESGARIFESTLVTAVADGEVRTERARVRAGAVVVCTNAYAPHLVRARIRPVRGQMLATAPLARRVFARPAYAHRGFRYWRQTADGRVLVGGWRDLAPEIELGEEERLNDGIQAALDAFLRERGVDAPVTHRWAGIMGFSHDGLPYCGRVAGGVYLCGGFTGHGNGFVVEMGEMLADLVQGRTHADADLFDPERP